MEQKKQYSKWPCKPNASTLSLGLSKEIMLQSNVSITEPSRYIQQPPNNQMRGTLNFMARDGIQLSQVNQIQMLSALRSIRGSNTCQGSVRFYDPITALECNGVIIRSLMVLQVSGSRPDRDRHPEMCRKATEIHQAPQETETMLLSVMSIAT